MFLSPDKGWAELHRKGLGVGSAGNKAAVKEAGVGEERHLAQAGAKGAEPTAVRLWKMGSEQVPCERRAAERPG